MKKVLVIFLCINFFTTPVLAVINDDFAERTLDKSLTVSKPKEYVIEDNLLNISNKKLELTKTEQAPIIDTFAESSEFKPISVKKVSIQESVPKVKKELYIEKRPNFCLTQAAEKTAVDIKVKSYITTRDMVEEGDFISFETVSDVNLAGKQYPKGTTVKGRVETVSMNYAFGIPADLIVGNFFINDTPLTGEVRRIGANRRLWVYPISVVGSVFLGLGILFCPIRGGHAKIKPNKKFTVYYVPVI